MRARELEKEEQENRQKNEREAADKAIAEKKAADAERKAELALEKAGSIKIREKL